MNPPRPYLTGPEINSWTSQVHSSGILEQGSDLELSLGTWTRNHDRCVGPHALREAEKSHTQWVHRETGRGETAQLQTN